MGHQQGIVQFSNRTPSIGIVLLYIVDRGMPTPAWWHVRKWYAYDLMTGEWEVTEQRRVFDFGPGLLVDAEFQRLPKKDMWDRAISRTREADDP